MILECILSEAAFIRFTPSARESGSRESADPGHGHPGSARIPDGAGRRRSCDAACRKSDRVAMGQKIGEPSGFISAAVHATVSGTVRSVEPRPHPGGGYVLAVVVENDGQYTPVDTAQPLGADASAGEIVAAVRELGIVGMGGATFPTHVKLMPPKDAVIDTLILNGAECEPYLTADHRLMLEQPPDTPGRRYRARVLPHPPRHRRHGAASATRYAMRTPLRAATITVSLRVKYPQGASAHMGPARRKVPTDCRSPWASWS